MLKTANKVVSLADAARVIYNTKTPSDEQIRRVYHRLKSGVLQSHDRSGAPLTWTTTEQSLADFLAEQTLQQQEGRRGAEAPAKTYAPQCARGPAAASQATEPFRELYRDICRDYFLAVFLRRRLAHRSVSFHRAALAGQVLGLVALVATMSGAVGFSLTRTPPEHAAIERWIDDHSDRFQVVRWMPAEPAPDGRGTIVRVEYRYRVEGNKSVQTDRRFRVAEDEVTELVESE